MFFAPEVFSGLGYSFAVDWWALGCFVFDLMSGHSPFEHVTSMLELCQAITRGTDVMRMGEKWPMRVCCSAGGVEAWHFFQHLTKKDPEKRLPLKSGGLA